MSRRGKLRHRKAFEKLLGDPGDELCRSRRFQGCIRPGECSACISLTDCHLSENPCKLGRSVEPGIASPRTAPAFGLDRTAMAPIPESQHPCRRSSLVHIAGIPSQGGGEPGKPPRPSWCILFSWARVEHILLSLRAGASHVFVEGIGSQGVASRTNRQSRSVVSCSDGSSRSHLSVPRPGHRCTGRDSGEVLPERFGSVVFSIS